MDIVDVSSYHAMMANVATGRYACLLGSVLALLTLPAGCQTHYVTRPPPSLSGAAVCVSPILDVLRQLLLAPAAGNSPAAPSNTPLAVNSEGLNDPVRLAPIGDQRPDYLSDAVSRR